MKITKEDIRKILDDELHAGINKSIWGTHGFVSGKNEAVNSLYELFIKESTPEQIMPSGSDQQDHQDYLDSVNDWREEGE